MAILSGLGMLLVPDVPEKNQPNRPLFPTQGLCSQYLWGCIHKAHLLIMQKSLASDVGSLNASQTQYNLGLIYFNLFN